VAGGAHLQILQLTGIKDVSLYFTFHLIFMTLVWTK